MEKVALWCGLGRVEMAEHKYSISRQVNGEYPTLILTFKKTLGINQRVACDNWTDSDHSAGAERLHEMLNSEFEIMKSWKVITF